MSGFQDYERCLRCDGVCFVDFNCRTLEEYRFCERCGKTEKYYIRRDDDSNAILDENGAPEYIDEKSGGYGCITIVMNLGVSGMYALDEPGDLEKMKAEYLKKLEDPKVNKENSYFTYWDSENKQIVAVFGEDPGEYGQWAASRKKSGEEKPL